MPLIVSTENYAKSRFFTEHGLFYLIDCKGEKILDRRGYTNHEIDHVFNKA